MSDLRTAVEDVIEYLGEAIDGTRKLVSRSKVISARNRLKRAVEKHSDPAVHGGGPSEPCGFSPVESHDGGGVAFETLRDKFALTAMELFFHLRGSDSFDRVAEQSYQLADAMLRRRNQTTG